MRSKVSSFFVVFFWTEKSCDGLDDYPPAGDGVLLLLHVGQVPPRAAQLHRPARDVHPREAEADQADHHLLPVLQRGRWHPPLY
jgi:hypothetical protein